MERKIEVSTITCLFCPPGKKPELRQISNKVEDIEVLLEGPLGIIELEEDGLCLLFNDIGEKKALDLNRVIKGDPIFGSCIFCRKVGDQLNSLTEEEIQELEYLLS
ncbi:MAG TPA: DUF3846 domain-containing protein [Peptococcaceae bacterium]|nr:DUF3846 domain-containing protein [Peptococcaceae bacterium]